MLNAELWTEGGTIVLIGMTIVFSFLVITVFAINIMARIVKFIDKVCPVVVEEPKKAKKASTNQDAEIALAIMVAKSQG